MFEELTGPVVVIALTIAGCVWWFKSAMEKITEKIYNIEQELQDHSNQERIENATSGLGYQSLKEQLDRIENKINWKK